MNAEELRTLLAEGGDLSADQMSAVLATGDVKVISLALRSGLVDEAGIRTIAANTSLRWTLVHVPELPADVVDLLVDSDAVALVAQYRTLPAELAETLSRHPDRRVRRALARNASTPPALLARLSSEDFVSFALAENPATPVEVLVTLAAHESFAVRRVTALRTDLPPALYEQLARDENQVVRAALAGNPALPAAVRARLQP
ncbi:hypothetical protein BBK82_27475 [Lentzea guizhouensis]|uniref:Leucine rich repeat variant n=1 Tax=Lentzea guizhouensis TaxID=1586287 RepID=A0A1B2HNE0_9PSEU|nr:hypothetical protein [Lentzea guizhouensis]ANZ39247.1 hypothetical protein BBK82_27475 [Lentzea guizhouensis]